MEGVLQSSLQPLCQCILMLYTALPEWKSSWEQLLCVCVEETERGIEKHDIMKTNEHVQYTQNHGRYENPFLKGIYRV